MKGLGELATPIHTLSLEEQTKLYLLEETQKNGLTFNEYRLLVSIINCESGFNPRATHQNLNRSTDYGIFQINNRSWDILAQQLKLDYKNNTLDNIKLGVLLYRREGIGIWVCSGYRS